MTFFYKDNHYNEKKATRQTHYVTRILKLNDKECAWNDGLANDAN